MLKKIVFSTAVLALGIAPLSAADYLFDKSHSSVAFSIKHMMVSKVKGSFNDYEAKVAYDEAKQELTMLEGVVKVASIDTKNSARDDHLRAPDFFDVAKFPEMRFKMTRFERREVKHNEVSGKAHGELTIRDVTRPVVFDVEIKGPLVDMNGKKRIGVELDGDISRKDFGLTWNKVIEGGGVAVGDEVDIEIEFEAAVR